ncbi:hypothetical protein LEMLEM_LOCUS2019, partial [Lemmus lemmus]
SSLPPTDALPPPGTARPPVRPPARPSAAARLSVTSRDRGRGGALRWKEQDWRRAALHTVATTASSVSCSHLHHRDLLLPWNCSHSLLTLQLSWTASADSLQRKEGGGLKEKKRKEKEGRKEGRKKERKEGRKNKPNDTRRGQQESDSDFNRKTQFKFENH